MSARTSMVMLTATMCFLAQAAHVAASIENPVILAQVPSYPLPPEGRERMAAAWSPDGLKLVYSGPSSSPTIPGPATVLDLKARPSVPREISSQAAYDTAWSWDGRSVVFITARQDDGRQTKTILLQPEQGDGPAVDLLPGQMATKGIYEVEGIEEWVGPRLLAYSALVGSGGIRSLFVKNVDQPSVWPESPGRDANWFTWSPDKSQVAGQMWEGDFWIWDFKTKTFLNMPARQEGQWRVIEDWGPDGTILFTLWSNMYTYWGKSPRPQGLYKMNLQTGSTTRIAENGVMASASDSAVAYVELGSTPRLRVRNWSGSTQWTEQLGAFSQAWLGQVRNYRPRFVGPFLAYRHTDGDWFVASTSQHNSERIASGKDPVVSWRPDGHYAAIHRGGRMTVILNPLSNRGKRPERTWNQNRTRGAHQPPSFSTSSSGSGKIRSDGE